jgi:large subunit ribosomal protein L21
MYAVIKAGGHQYRVQTGDQVEIDFREGNAGDKIKFDEVLMLNQDGKNVLGAPVVAGASVEATIKSQIRGDKILVFHYRRRKNSKKIRGHRQQYTVVEIGKISK